MNAKKPRIYARRKWTIEGLNNWIQITVWLVRHGDGTIEETSSPSEAFAAAHIKFTESRVHYAH